ncbi:hypothetical protein Ndes2526B_g06016 [Nannochloris sp. 'desiccata']|nr:hypothetical protein NADE_005911 [Chlorella desiccata (nom. nud.)]
MIPTYFSATRLKALSTPTKRIQNSIRCSAAAAASPEPGFLHFSGAGKSGAVTFSSMPSSSSSSSSSAATKPTQPQEKSIVSPSAGPGSLQFVGAGKMGTVSFTSSPKPILLRDRLAAAGLAGIVAYGIFNTLYYTVAFLMVFKLAKVPSGQGIAASAQAALKILAVVWAGSQVTKVARAGAALLAVPFVDALLDLIKRKFSLGSKRDAFLRVIFPACILVAVVLFSGITLLYM